MENKKYKIIYADCPWEYVKLNFYQKKGVNNKVYNRMKIEDIKSLKIDFLTFLGKYSFFKSILEPLRISGMDGYYMIGINCIDNLFKFTF
jgi:hypothetical protein